MYQLHWGLHEAPFRSGLAPRYFYKSPTHDEALARLHFLVERQRRLGLLLGGPGSGKSLVLEVLAHELRRTGQTVGQASLFKTDGHELLWTLASKLGLNPSPAQTTFRLWRVLTDHFAENRQQRLSTVLLLDDADEASEEVLSYVVRLLQSDPSAESRLTVALACDGARLDRLGKRLLTLAELRIDLHAWEHADTAEFLSTTLARAGRDAPAFDDAAITQLHELTQGVPRRVSQLADLALLAGAGKNLTQVDAETVENVYRELGVGEIIQLAAEAKGVATE